MQWEGGRIIGLGWTSSENLVCVLDEGTMVVYDLHGERVYSRPIARVSALVAKDKGVFIMCVQVVALHPFTLFVESSSIFE